MNWIMDLVDCGLGFGTQLFWTDAQFNDVVTIISKRLRVDQLQSQHKVHTMA